MPPRRLGALAILFASLAAPAVAQALPEGAPSTRVWVRAESSAWAQPLWVGGGLGVTVERGDLVGEANYSVAESFWGGTSSNVVSVSAGFHQRVGPLDIGLQAGPALLWGTNSRAPSGDQRYQTIGGVSKVSVLLGMGPAVQIGVEGRVNASSPMMSVGGGPVLRVKLAGGR